MNKKIVMLSLLGLIGIMELTGCASSNDPIPVPISESTGKSRIRVFGRNGANADLYAGKACVGGQGGINVSGSLGSALGSFIGVSSNEPIGIPETSATLNLSQQSSFLSKTYYREYEIPGGTPTSLELGITVVGGYYCSGALSFTPEAGQDYETGFSLSGGRCHLKIYHIVKQENEQSTIEPVMLQRAPKC